MKSIPFWQEQATLTSLQDVMFDLQKTAPESTWATRSLGWTTQAIAELTDAGFTQWWYVPAFPVSALQTLVLPEHRHLVSEVLPAPLFGDGTTGTKAVETYKAQRDSYVPECMNLIASLEESIRTQGFTTSLTLKWENEMASHIDGLHRIIALLSTYSATHNPTTVPTYIVCKNA
ncbi:MAG: hypothetical protein KC925_02680 [Candidatus Doudnabacteria bacterium]|nr:hypothetical protein [Candidatus Doudnabacteria bacterium]